MIALSQFTAGQINYFHDSDEISSHFNEVIGFNNESLLVAVPRPGNNELYDFAPLPPQEIRSVSIKFVFLPFNIILGAIIAALGAGWFWGFFMGWIPVLFYVIAGAMVVIGLGMMLVCFETRAFIDLRDGSQVRACGIGDHKDNLRQWLTQRGVPVM